MTGVNGLRQHSFKCEASRNTPIQGRSNNKTKNQGKRALCGHMRGTTFLSHLTWASHLVMTKYSLRKMSASSCSGGLCTSTLIMQ